MTACLVFGLQLLDFCNVVAQMLGVNMPASVPSCEVIKRLEVLIHSGHHFPLASQCVMPHHHHHMALIPDTPVWPITTAGSPGDDIPAQPLLPTTTTTWAAVQQSYIVFPRHSSIYDLRTLVIYQFKCGAHWEWINYCSADSDCFNKRLFFLHCDICILYMTNYLFVL